MPRDAAVLWLQAHALTRIQFRWLDYLGIGKLEGMRGQVLVQLKLRGLEHALHLRSWFRSHQSNQFAFEAWYAIAWIVCPGANVTGEFNTQDGDP